MGFKRLAFHPGNHLDLVFRVGGVIHQLADLVLHEAGELDVEIRIRVGDGFKNLPQVVLVEFCQLREAVVGE